jgi:hypothetical protein
VLVRDPAELSSTELATLGQIRTNSDVALAYGLAQRFVHMIWCQEVTHLDPWLSACAACGISALASFGEGLQRDSSAVRATLALPWSSGQAEGQINRLKMHGARCTGGLASDFFAAVSCEPPESEAPHAIANSAGDPLQRVNSTMRIRAASLPEQRLSQARCSSWTSVPSIKNSTCARVVSRIPFAWAASVQPSR